MRLLFRENMENESLKRILVPKKNTKLHDQFRVRLVEDSAIFRTNLERSENSETAGRAFG